MKLLLILILISVSGCSSTSNNWSVANQYNPVKSTWDLGYNLSKKSYYTVPEQSRLEHKRCVDFALREMSVGESCQWNHPYHAQGIVQLVKIDANNCHYLFNTMEYKGKTKHWQSTACYKRNIRKWDIR